MRYAASALMGTTLCLALLTSVSIASAQTLGDLARKEEERRKAVTPGRVYTNESLGKAQSPPPPPAVSTPASPEKTAPSQPQASGEAAQADSATKDEAYWRGRIQAEREALTRAKVLIDALQGRVNSLQTEFVNRDDPASRATITAERQSALAELERMKLDIQQRNKAIADIQEEARRAGVPPAWYR